MSKLAIIGGTELYQVDALTIINEHDVATPFGIPSAPIIEGRFGQAKSTFLFLPRHGRSHEYLPSEVNYRANIFALKRLGARRVLSVSATGSLNQNITPGSLALVDQYFDHTRGQRPYSFFGDGVIAHISTARPACPALTHDVFSAARAQGLDMHTGMTYACVEGPRLGTRIESLFLRNIGCDLVGMTNVPEAFLAREAQMAYCTLAIATDYDCWLEDPNQHAQADEIIKLYKNNISSDTNITKTFRG